MFAEDFDGVALLAVYVRYVYHRHVHADITHILCLLPVYKAVGMAVAEMPVQTVGIAYRYGGYDAVTVKHRAAAIPYTFACLDSVFLQDGCLQRAHTVDGGIVHRVDAVKAQSEAAHVQLPFGEVLYACGIADMAQYLVVKGCLKLSAPLVEEFKLPGGECIEVRTVTAHKV